MKRLEVFSKTVCLGRWGANRCELCSDGRAPLDCYRLRLVLATLLTFICWDIFIRLSHHQRLFMAAKIIWLRSMLQLLEYLTWGVYANGRCDYIILVDWLTSIFWLRHHFTSPLGTYFTFAGFRMHLFRLKDTLRCCLTMLLSKSDQKLDCTGILNGQNFHFVS